MACIIQVFADGIPYAGIFGSTGRPGCLLPEYLFQSAAVKEEQYNKTHKHHREYYGDGDNKIAERPGPYRLCQGGSAAAAVSAAVIIYLFTIRTLPHI